MSRNKATWSILVPRHTQEGRTREGGLKAAPGQQPRDRAGGAGDRKGQAEERAGNSPHQDWGGGWVGRGP